MTNPNFSDPNFSKLWRLDPKITFLNHGAFGACPIAILEKQQAWRSQLESEPLRFYEREFEPLLDQSRQVLANFVGADPTELVFIPNATTGVNTVLRSLAPTFHPGDELLTTNHCYNACRNALNFVAAQTGAAIVVADVPFPLQSSADITAAVLDCVSDRTKLLLLDHVTSQTGLIFPVEAIARALADRQIDILVDGAHALGMIPLDLRNLGVTYYASNCHKWLCAPKGSGFLYVRAEQQAQIRPLVISHGANDPRDRPRFWLEFDWTGTDDFTPYLCVAEAIAWMGSLLPGGWAELMGRNHQLAVAARSRLATSLHIEPPCPVELIGSLATLPLPPGDVRSLKDALFYEFQIEVPIMPWQGVTDRLLRISAQLYNQPSDYDVLASALAHLRVNSRSL